MKPETLRSMILSAVMAAFGITLPIAFHMMGLGNKFLPMLLPILLNGFLSRLPWALATGAFVPLASALLTGMPSFYPPIALVMSVEGALMAGTAAIIYRFNRVRIWPALITAVAVDRTVSATLMWLISGKFGLPATVVSFGGLIHGLPGVALQLAVVPPVVRALMARKGILFHLDDKSTTSVLQ
jgi:hypothetical protein